RLRQWYHYTRFKRLTRILSSPPVPCEPGAQCALHTVLSGKDLPLYLAAVKSFLRFAPAVAVVVHSAGALHERDGGALHRPLPGCKVIGAAEADARARATLDPDSLLARFRGWDASWRRVIDTEIWGFTRKRIIMDSDILTLRPPSEVIRWIENEEGPFLLGQP